MENKEMQQNPKDGNSFVWEVISVWFPLLALRIIIKMILMFTMCRCIEFSLTFSEMQESAIQYNEYFQRSPWGRNPGLPICLLVCTNKLNILRMRMHWYVKKKTLQILPLIALGPDLRS